MRRSLFMMLLFLLVSSCHRHSDPLIGRWTVEKVNVEFDEKKATPEMVRQYGEMEKGNVIEISKDSVLILVSEGDTLKSRCSLRGDQLYCDGAVFAKFENGDLITETSTPMGKVRVVYRKK